MTRDRFEVRAFGVGPLSNRSYYYVVQDCRTAEFTCDNHHFRDQRLADSISRSLNHAYEAGRKEVTIIVRQAAEHG